MPERTRGAMGGSYRRPDIDAEANNTLAEYHRRPHPASAKSEPGIDE